MNCTSYGLTMQPPSSKPSFPTKPDPLLFFPTTFRPINPTGSSSSSSSSLKAKATVKDPFINEEEEVETVETLSFYELLGIPKSGSLLDIKHAYKQLARKYHPDVSPPDLLEENTQRFIQVKEAYEVLSDPRSRAVYDRDMANGLHLAFSTGRQYNQYHQCRQGVEEKNEWKSRWQSQLSELKRRSMYKDATNMSWGARMRRQREEKERLQEL
ncbi:hypothetical protein ACFE04_008814 [Oxalis oulophora]